MSEQPFKIGDLVDTINDGSYFRGTIIDISGQLAVVKASWGEVQVCHFKYLTKVDE